MTALSDTELFLTSKQTATLLGIKPNTLEVWRVKGRGPQFIKCGSSRNSIIRYPKSAITAFAQHQLYASTSAYSATAKANIRRPRKATS